jgi:hypothetical protein
MKNIFVRLFYISRSIFAMHCMVTAAQIAVAGYCLLLGRPVFLFFAGEDSVIVLLLLCGGWLVTTFSLLALREWAK